MLAGLVVQVLYSARLYSQRDIYRCIAWVDFQLFLPRVLELFLGLGWERNLNQVKPICPGYFDTPRAALIGLKPLPMLSFMPLLLPHISLWHTRNLAPATLDQKYKPPRSGHQLNAIQPSFTLSSFIYCRSPFYYLFQCLTLFVAPSNGLCLFSCCLIRLRCWLIYSL